MYLGCKSLDDHQMAEQQIPSGFFPLSCPWWPSGFLQCTSGNLNHAGYYYIFLFVTQLCWTQGCCCWQWQWVTSAKCVYQYFLYRKANEIQKSCKKYFCKCPLVQYCLNTKKKLEILQFFKTSEFKQFSLKISMLIYMELCRLCSLSRKYYKLKFNPFY